MLDVLGLNPAEQGVYLALVEGRPATIDELQTATHLPRVPLTQALEALEANGLVSRNPGPPARYTAVAPDLALEVLLAAQEEQLARTRLAIEQLAARFRASSYQRDPVELIEVVTGAQAILTRSRQLQRSAQSQVRAISAPPYPTPPGEINPAELNRLRHGVPYRVLYDPAGLVAPARHDLRTDVELGVREGEQARILPLAPFTMCLVDDRIGWVPLQLAPAAPVSALVIHNSSLLDALAQLFEHLWAQALPLPLASQHDTASGPTDDERRLLALLVSGVPDDSAARQLGVSLRTLHRRLHELTARLGVETRFQAGMQATLLGWITRP